MTHNGDRAQVGMNVGKAIGGALLLITFVLSGTGLAGAQSDYPNRPLRFVVPFSAGSAPDQIARTIGAHMERSLQQPIVIDNKPGANGTIGATEAARAAPDGYTIFAGTSGSMVLNPILFKTLNYDAAKDFIPVARFITAALALVVKPDFPANNLREFVAYGRARPNQLTGGYSSPGTQVSLAQLKTLVDVQVLGVPYRGVPPTVSDVVSGQISLTFADYAVAFPLIEAGKLKSLGVTAPTRTSLKPDLPAITEEIPGFDVTVWNGLAVPAGTPRHAVQRLWDAAKAAMNDPKVTARLRSMAQEPALLDPDAFAKFIAAERPKWARQIQAAGIQPQ